jgi:curved DNA-binding protein CbpA
MSDDTYYTLLDVSETATQLEIKTAYRNLLKKIHPDTVSTLSPELRRTAEDLTKEIIEAFEVLSDAGRRREYDLQLAEYRPQSAPAAPPREPIAAPTSTPRTTRRTYVSPPTRAPKPRAGAWGTIGRVFSRGTIAFLPLIIWVAIAILIQQSDSCGNPESPRTDSTLHQADGSASNYRSQDVASYCNTHPTSFYGALGTASGVSCSDWAHLTSAEQQSIQAACSQSQYFEGPAAYNRCLALELKEWASGPKQPDLSHMTDAELSSIQAACSDAKYLKGPAAYNRCLALELKEWASGPKQPDLSRLTRKEQNSIESACSAKFMHGPAAYDRCLIRELKDRAHT